MTFPFAPLKMFGYDVIVADPPWDFQNYSDAGTVKGADPHYKVMSLAAIKALPVGQLGNPDTILLLWATGAMLPQALDVMAAWGFRYTSEIIWNKRTVNNRPRWGTGYRVRSLHEPILMGTTGGRQWHKAFPSAFDGVAREHSRKPEEFYWMVNRLTPEATRCDLFSREDRVGWECWGNEVGKFNKSHEDQGTGFDSGATGHELQGREAV